MKTKFFTILWIVAMAFFMAACNSDGDETIALEYGNPQKMLVGIWTDGKCYRIVDEEVKEEVDNPDAWLVDPLEFYDDGTYTTGDGKTYKWYFNESTEDYPYTGDIVLNGYTYSIVSMGNGKLVIERPIGGYTYRWEFGKSSTPEDEGGEDNGGGNDWTIEGLGNTSDKNPYKPVSSKLVSKITREMTYTKDKTTSKVVYLFKYDKKSRIIEYTIQSYNTTTNSVAESETYNFTYDNTNVYLYCNGKILNKGVIGSNGYLTTLYDGNSTKVSGTFRYTDYGDYGYKATYIASGTNNWSPEYKKWSKGLTSNGLGDAFDYSADFPNIVGSVDFNGLFYTSYQWEWFMHLDKPQVIWGLFDFCGSRSRTIARSCQRGNYWKDECTGRQFIDTSVDYSDWAISQFQITRTAINDPFIADYTIEYQK